MCYELPFHNLPIANYQIKESNSNQKGAPGVVSHMEFLLLGEVILDQKLKGSLGYTRRHL